MKHTKVYESPRISANELARFMVSGDVGRKGIIKRAKEKSAAVAVRYSDVRDVIQTGLCDPYGDQKIIAAARLSFQQKGEDGALTDWSREDARKSQDVLDSYVKMRNQLVGYQYTKPPEKQDPLIIGGVPVSVNCDLLIQGEVKGKPGRGAVLLRLTKPDEEETSAAKEKRLDMGVYAAVMVRMYAEGIGSFNDPIHHELCWSLDIQSGEIHRAPKNYTQRRNRLEAACEFIAAMWDRV